MEGHFSGPGQVHDATYTSHASLSIKSFFDECFCLPSRLHRTYYTHLLCAVALVPARRPPCRRSLLLLCALKIVQYFVTMIVSISGVGWGQTYHARWMVVMDPPGRDPSFTACWFGVTGILDKLSFLSCCVSLFFLLWSLKDSFIECSVPQFYSSFKQHLTEIFHNLDYLYDKVSKAWSHGWLPHSTIIKTPRKQDQSNKTGPLGPKWAETSAFPSPTVVTLDETLGMIPAWCFIPFFFLLFR